MNVKKFLEDLVEKYNLLDEKVVIKVADPKLDTKRIKDYPLVTGKEVLLRAYLKGCKGEAFTDKPIEFEGTIREVLERNNIQELVAVLNAVMKYLNLTDKTEHCKGDEPERCAKELAKMLKEENIKRVGIIGFQPAFVKELVKTFGAENVIVSDLNPENVGKVKYGVKVIHGSNNEELIKKSDIVLATGSTIVNGTFEEIYNLAKKYNKRIIFYGTTIAGISKLLNLERFCVLGR
ncbi:Rossmann-like domain-containing protein [Methanocaldococcus infernus]